MDYPLQPTRSPEPKLPTPFAPPFSAASPNAAPHFLGSLSVSYDFSGLGKLAKNADFVREIQQLFIGRVPQQLAELQALIEREDWPMAAGSAHSLKSTFGNLKVEPGTSLLCQIEQVAQQPGDKSQLPTLLQAVFSSANIVVELFKQELNLVA